MPTTPSPSRSWWAWPVGRFGVRACGGLVVFSRPAVPAATCGAGRRPSTSRAGFHVGTTAGTTEDTTAGTPAGTTAGTPPSPPVIGRFRRSEPVLGSPEGQTTPSVCPSALAARGGWVRFWVTVRTARVPILRGCWSWWRPAKAGRPDTAWPRPGPPPSAPSHARRAASSHPGARPCRRPGPTDSSGPATARPAARRTGRRRHRRAAPRPYPGRRPGERPPSRPGPPRTPRYRPAASGGRRGPGRRHPAVPPRPAAGTDTAARPAAYRPGPDDHRDRPADRAKTSRHRPGTVQPPQPSEVVRGRERHVAKGEAWS